MSTASDLALLVGQELRIVGAGEALEAHDHADIVRKYKFALQTLESRGLAAFAEDAIPEAYLMPLVQYVTAIVAPTYGREYMSIPAALREFNGVASVPYDGADTEVDSF